MEFRQIKYFIEVAKREHMTEAADVLHVAQSAISRQISNLESELGIQLFLREGRNLRLTPIGRIFMEHAEMAMKEMDKAIQEIEEFMDPEKGTISVGFPSSLAAHTLPLVISAFRAEHPHVGFRLKQGSFRNLIDSVSKGEIDLAFVGPVPTQEANVHGHILFQEHLFALLPINHPLSDLPSIRLNQLREDSFVLFPSGFILRTLVVDACSQMGFSPKVSFEGEDIDAIKGLVAAGLGVTLLPEVTLFDSLPRATVKIPISEPRVTRTVGVIIPSNRELAPSEKLFYSFLRDFFKNLDRFNQ